jgi:hypothetical protein
MPYDSKADLIVRLAEIRVEIAKARRAMSVNSGGTELVRPRLKELIDEEKWVLSLIAQVDAAAGTDGGGGTANKVQFGRPI